MTLGSRLRMRYTVLDKWASLAERRAISRKYRALTPLKSTRSQVELVKVTTPDDSRSEHESLTKHAEAILKVSCQCLNLRLMRRNRTA